MKSAILMLTMTLVYGCAVRVDTPESPDNTDSASASGDATGGGTGATDIGIPCSVLHGAVTLTSYNGDKDKYASSAFSFEYASQDAAITNNEFDVFYGNDLFRVNTVTDDKSLIVDLGKMELTSVPAKVDPDGYPMGQFGTHDEVQAQLEHTYFVRSVDNSGRLVSAFRVIGLNPGRRVTIEWIRSSDADILVVPTTCL